jgi:hypothetical protein
MLRDAANVTQCESPCAQVKNRLTLHMSQHTCTYSRLRGVEAHLREAHTIDARDNSWSMHSFLCDNALLVAIIMLACHRCGSQPAPCPHQGACASAKVEAGKRTLKACMDAFDGAEGTIVALDGHADVSGRRDSAKRGVYKLSDITCFKLSHDCKYRCPLLVSAGTFFLQWKLGCYLPAAPIQPPTSLGQVSCDKKRCEGM